MAAPASHWAILIILWLNVDRQTSNQKDHLALEFPGAVTDRISTAQTATEMTSGDTPG